MMVNLVFQSVFAEDMNLVVTLDRADLQRRVDRLFPIQRENELISVRLHHPQVILTEHSDRIGLRLHVDATAGAQFSVSGNALVDGVLRFTPADGDIFLDDASVEELHIDGVPPLYANQIRQLADSVIRDLLQDYPIYTLGHGSKSQRIMGSDIKSVTVHEGKLFLELEMP